MAVVENAVSLISSNMDIGEDDMRMFVERTEIVEKTFL